jgi:hypothetical protein
MNEINVVTDSGHKNKLQIFEILNPFRTEKRDNNVSI